MAGGGQGNIVELPPTLVDVISDVRHYTGGEACDYRCGNVAEFVIEVEETAVFFACYDCANTNNIYPQDRLDLLRGSEKERWS